jgi:predicted permease
MAIPLARLFVRQKGTERGIYTYALAFANGGYVGDPVVQSLFGDEVLSYYKIFYLPLNIMIYTWGIKQLVPSREEKRGFFKQILNAPTVAMLLGIFVGLTGIGKYIPDFAVNALDSLKVCMGPVAMLLAGFTIANYNVLGMLKKGKIYMAALLRLFVLPMIIVFVIFGVKEAVNHILGTDINNSVLFLAFFSTASALGLNTVVFPEAYGGNPETGAGMALISHTLCVISIPIMYTVMVALFGPLSI